MEEKAKAAEAKAYQDMEDTAREKREGEDESDVETPRKKKTKHRRAGTPKRKAKATPKKGKRTKKRESDADAADDGPSEMTPKTKKKKTAQECTC